METVLLLFYNYNQCLRIDIQSNYLVRNPRRGRQRKAWGRVVDELFVCLRILRGECRTAFAIPMQKRSERSDTHTHTKGSGMHRLRGTRNLLYACASRIQVEPPHEALIQH